MSRNIWGICFQANGNGDLPQLIEKGQARFLERTGQAATAVSLGKGIVLPEGYSCPLIVANRKAEPGHIIVGTGIGAL